MAHRLPDFSPTLTQGDPMARLLLRTLGLPRVQDEFAHPRDRAPGRPVDIGELSEAEEFAAISALASPRVSLALVEVRAEAVIRAMDDQGPGVYLGRHA